MRLPRDSTPIMRATYATIRHGGREGVATPDLLANVQTHIPGATEGHLRAVLCYLRTTDRVETRGHWRGHRGLPSIVRASCYADRFSQFKLRPYVPPDELRYQGVSEQVAAYRKRCEMKRQGPPSTEPTILRLIGRRETVLSRDVAEGLGLTMKTVKERLLKAYRDGMLCRWSEMIDGRKHYRYRLSEAGSIVTEPTAMAAR